MSEYITLSLDEVCALSYQVLTRHGLSDAHARAIAEVITQGQRDECHSHGVYRLLGCVRSVREGRIDPRPNRACGMFLPGCWRWMPITATPCWVFIPVCRSLRKRPAARGSPPW
ncbi:hypothetical protein PBOI14_17830 [Pseudomonas sp. Boi14]|nr:hypothetical protein PBOI14_17830 [Pseudomonas sp. Boi14]